MAQPVTPPWPAAVQEVADDSDDDREADAAGRLAAKKEPAQWHFEERMATKVGSPDLYTTLGPWIPFKGHLSPSIGCPLKAMV